ncbi:uncharacterized protein LOC136035722 [Artemia franciscana]|uniref:Cuticle protein n=1 Tax=Artemia franciscana TaxID=6661 RepID=A0AA88I514_ARTSF|nr:hypothetical protein QYM36_003563 [Artemia franciscana]
MEMPMKLFCVSSIIAFALSAPQGTRDESRSSTTQVPILNQINQVNDDGSYTFGYEAGDGTFKVETRDPRGNITGRYGYVDPEGYLKVVDYAAGTNTGFNAKANHIPVSPFPLPVPFGDSTGADLSFTSFVEVPQAKETIEIFNDQEDFGNDPDEDRILGTLENNISDLKRAPVPALSAPFAVPASVQTDVPLPQQQQTEPLFSAVQQESATNIQSEPNAFTQKTPPGFDLSFDAPVQNAKLEQLNQARPLLQKIPQLVIDQFQSHSFQPQSFHFNPQFIFFN